MKSERAVRTYLPTRDLLFRHCHQTIFSYRADL